MSALFFFHSPLLQTSCSILDFNKNVPQDNIFTLSFLLIVFPILTQSGHPNIRTAWCDKYLKDYKMKMT